MGSTARIFVCGGSPGTEARLRARLHDLENRWSRFLPTSEVSRANADAGQATAVSPETRLLVAQALRAAELTHGWFDPLLLEPLTDAGYERSYELLDTGDLGPLVAGVDRSGPMVSVVVRPPHESSATLDVDDGAGTVTVGSGVGFDPGGIGKGLAADLLATDAMADGASAVMIDLGGDIACAGRSPDAGWAVDVHDPFDPGRTCARVRIPWGAVATSSTIHRRWRHDGEIVAPTDRSADAAAQRLVDRAGDGDRRGLLAGGGVGEGRVAGGTDRRAGAAGRHRRRGTAGVRRRHAHRDARLVGLHGRVDVVIVEPEKWTWYVARSGGIVAWLLLAAGLVVGLLLSSKLLGRRVSPAWLLSVHRYLGGLSVVFTAVHVAAVMLDDFVRLRLGRRAGAVRIRVAARGGGVGHRRDVPARRDRVHLAGDATPAQGVVAHRALEQRRTLRHGDGARLAGRHRRGAGRSWRRP